MSHSKAYEVRSISNQSTEYHFDLIGYVEEEEYYTNLLHVLRTANPQDVIHIHISSPGGYVSTMTQILHNMDMCQAEVIGHLEGQCHSAATFIFLGCDNWVINPDAILLFHSISGGSWGEAHKMIAGALATNEWGQRLAERYYYPFLSKKEIKKLTEGKDFWMFGDEVSKRLKENLIPFREEQEKAQEEEIREETKKQLLELAESCQGSDS